MNLRHDCAVIALGLLLGGCSILPKSESPNVYLLPATPVAATHPGVLPKSLRIVVPQAAQALDSTRIAVLPKNNVIASYADARWSDNAPRLLRDRLIDAFSTDGHFAALSSDEAQLLADLELTGNLRAFQSEYVQGVPVVVIRYDAQLVQVRSQRIIATHRFDIRQAVVGKEVPQVVIAFGQATDQLAAQIIAWVTRTETQAKHD
jgi:cholesterol transport system auxiliary component